MSETKVRLKFLVAGLEFMSETNPDLNFMSETKPD
jgi:hypothetical protein